MTGGGACCAKSAAAATDAAMIKTVSAPFADRREMGCDVMWFPSRDREY
jgi:hypothetical protein